MTVTRPLGTGDLVAVPGGRAVVVESVSWDGLWFAGATGGTWPAGVAELVPVPAEVACSA